MAMLQNNQIFSVSDLIAVLNQTLEYAYPSVMIEGEVSSFKINQGKYVFFDLKDSTGSLNCFMSIYQLRMPIDDGMKVVVMAVPKITAWGKFSLTIKSIRPSGEGAIKKSFEILKAKLESEGLFALDRKRQLPLIPQKLAIISSVQAAGYADFIKIVGDRWGGLVMDVGNVQVQGVDAPDQIIRAIEYFNSQEELPEAIVIIRGGGSADDLAVFSDERLVRAVAASRVPVVSGIGHETDESLVDLVADVRAATPSNAAQIIVPEKREIIRNSKIQVSALIPRIITTINEQQRRILEMLDGAIKTINISIDNKLKDIEYYKNIIIQFDPSTVLSRGYALIRGKQTVGEIIEVETINVIMKAEVKDVSKKAA